MKKNFIYLGLISILLTGCKTDERIFNLPKINIENLSISLPNKPIRGGSMTSLDGYDYLDFYELSDFHGAVNTDDFSNIGLSKLSSYLDIKRSKNPGGTIVLSGGDMFQGSIESNLSHGQMINYCMNYMGFDAMSVGNHEFDWGTDWLKKNAELTYNGEVLPFLGANIIDKKTNKMPTFLKSSTIINRGNYKIGIIGTIGATLENTITYSVSKDYDFTDEIEKVKSEAKILRESGCDVVVWLSHDEVKDNVLEGLKKSDGVDVAFGGHAHVNANEIKDGIPYIATAANGESIAHVQLKINKDTKAVSCSDCWYDANPLALNGLTNDPNIELIMGQYNKEINKVKNYKLGHTSERLHVEEELAMLCVDAIQTKTFEWVKKHNDVRIDSERIIAAYHNVNGGIRADIYPGDITYGDVYHSFPFDNEIVLFKVDGQTYKQSGGGYPYKNYGIWKNFTRMRNLDNDDYYIITIDYLALNRSGFKKEEDDLIRTGIYARNAIAEFIFNQNEIKTNLYTSENRSFQHPNY